MKLNEGLEVIADKEYLGRLIALGMDPSGRYEVIGYAVTGRSSGSQARVTGMRGKEGRFALNTMPTDDKEIDEAKRPLLIYDCMRRHGNSFVVSNGAQTNMIERRLITALNQNVYDPMRILADAFEKECMDGKIDVACYEPDGPNWTPRISGLITPGGAAMHIVKRANDDSRQQLISSVPLIAGEGKLLSTYTGQNVPSGEAIPSFQGEPWDIRIIGSTPEKVADHIYDALGPKIGKEYVTPGADFRVSVAVVFYDRKNNRVLDPAIINRHSD